jgi:peroxiredoxin
MKKYLSLAFFIGISAFSSAQQVADFTLTNAVDDKTVSLASHSSEAVVVLIFTSNICPYDGYYMGRITDLIRDYQGKASVLLVNSHTEAGESLENMARHASQNNIRVPYLSDKDQTVMKNLNAHKSPEAFVLKKSAAKFSVLYHGAIDDNPQVADDVKHHYLRKAIDAVLGGKTPPAHVRPVGCNIRKK